MRVRPKSRQKIRDALALGGGHFAVFVQRERAASHQGLAETVEQRLLGHLEGVLAARARHRKGSRGVQSQVLGIQRLGIEPGLLQAFQRNLRGAFERCMRVDVLARRKRRPKRETTVLAQRIVVAGGVDDEKGESGVGGGHGEFLGGISVREGSRSVAPLYCDAAARCERARWSGEKQTKSAVLQKKLCL